MTSVKLNGKEVTHPVLRPLVAVGVVAMGTLMFLWSMTVIIAIVLTSPVWVIADVILKRLGRRGFTFYDGRRFEVKFTSNAFRLTPREAARRLTRLSEEMGLYG